MWLNDHVHVHVHKQVCPPGLHITLGIFYRLFTLFEEACHELDLTAHVSADVAGATYGRYASALRQQSELKEEEGRVELQASGMEQLVTSLGIALPNAESQPAYQQLCSELGARKARLQKVVSYCRKWMVFHLMSTNVYACMHMTICMIESRDTEA